MGIMVKFGLYQQVISKKTGLPMIGSICGITTGHYQKWIYDCKNIHLQRWFDLYPDWVEKPVYTVKFNQAARTVTYEEYVKYAPEGMPISREQYEQDCPIKQLATYPEDDLEPLEESLEKPQEETDELDKSEITNKPTKEVNDVS